MLRPCYLVDIYTLLSRGLPIDLGARLTGLAEGGTDSLDAPGRLSEPAPPGEGGALPRPAWVTHGPHLFRGYEEPREVFEVCAKYVLIR